MRTCFILFGLLLMTLVLSVTLDKQQEETFSKENNEVLDMEEDSTNENIARIYLKNNSRVSTALKFSTQRKPKLI